jgi:rSAM/selenodomain-associated transferase 1
MDILDAFVVFTKQPKAGLSKTRLSPQLSDEQAAEISACFLNDILASARRLLGVSLILAYDPPDAEDYFHDLAPDFHCIPQQGVGLGDRMQGVFQTLFAEGFRRVVLVGSDLPQLDTLVFQQSFAALMDGIDLVLGPCKDGGYYLIGLTRPVPVLFNVQMSTSHVLVDTLAQAQAIGLQSKLVAEAFDIDTVADLVRLNQWIQADPTVPANQTRTWLSSHPNLSRPTI